MKGVASIKGANAATASASDTQHKYYNRPSQWSVKLIIRLEEDLLLHSLKSARAQVLKMHTTFQDF